MRSAMPRLCVVATGKLISPGKPYLTVSLSTLASTVRIFSRDADVSTLDDIAEKTGGRAFYPKKSSDLVAAFQEIEQELRSQYLLAYSSTNKQHDGRFRSMKIEIANPILAKEKLNLRYRPGYFAKKGE